MNQGGVERRRGRRVPMQASIIVRRVDQPQPAGEHITQNISLAGTYFEMDGLHDFSVNDQVVASVSIPESERRTFPFTRLAGRGRVVRVSELTPTPPPSATRYGIALEFRQDITALTTIPLRG